MASAKRYEMHIVTEVSNMYCKAERDMVNLHRTEKRTIYVDEGE